MLSLLESKSIENLGIDSFEYFRCILGVNFHGPCLVLSLISGYGEKPDYRVYARVRGGLGLGWDWERAGDVTLYTERPPS